MRPCSPPLLLHVLFAIWTSVPVFGSLFMETKEIAPDVYMPVMSIGTGGREKRDAKQIVSNWLELGGTAIDTALNYNNQDVVRQAMEEQSNISRTDIFITTKIPDCNVSAIKNNVAQDLKLLGTSYIDLMLIHGPRNGDCVEAWKILEEYYIQNVTRAIGVSNFRKAHLEPLLSGRIVPHVNQIALNLFVKDTETLLYAENHGITIEAYSPLGRGGTRGGSISHNLVVQRVAAAHNVTPYQIALRWILQHGWVLTFQSSSQNHQAVDADVFTFTLSTDEMNALDGISEQATSGN